MTERVNLSPISMLKLTILMDNVTDRLLPNPYPFVKRAPMIANQKVLPPPVAEHGFSVLLEVADTKKENSDSENKIKNDKSSKKNEKNKYLFDTGVSENGVVYNARCIWN